MIYEKDIAFVTILVLTLLSQHLKAQSPLYNKIPSSVISPQKEVCRRMFGLTEKQKDICVKKPNEILAIYEGLKTSAQECEHQFKSRRWNCSALGEDFELAKNRAIAGTKEAAFTSAIWAAGVAHAVTRACSMGNLTTRCGCDRSKEGKQDPDGWTWGCSADIEYGINISQKFVDAQENGKGGIVLMNKHNAEAGHKVVKKSMQLECKCHGASRSCSVKTCWHSLPYFRDVGNIIKEKYENAIKVSTYDVQTSTGREAISLTLPRINKDNDKPEIPVKPREDVLVYLNDSPNYCSRDKIKGTLGTVGRICNNTSVSFDSCESMCCGRGYNTHQFVHTSGCHCKFYWCCYVKCKRCRDKVTRYTCK